MEQLQQEWNKLDNKVRFIRAIISGELKVQNRKRADIVVEMRRLKYTPIPKGKGKEDHCLHLKMNKMWLQTRDTKGLSDFDYLLSMPIYSLTAEKVEEFSNNWIRRDKKLTNYLL